MYYFYGDDWISDGFSWKRALTLVTASKLAYENGDVVVNAVTKSWGFSECRTIDVNETQAFVASSSDVVILSFRGTESLGDWLGNLRLLSSSRRYGKVHSGFLAGYLLARAEIAAALQQAGAADKPLFITGHSLGGALAAIFAAEDWETFNVSGIYTFGQPRTGKAGFRSFIDSKYPYRYFRFVNDDDVVPRVPPGYEHVGELIHFDAFGDVRQTSNALEAAVIEPPPLSEPEFYELQREIKQVQIGVAASGESIEAVDVSVEGLFPSVSDHSIEQYVAAVRRNAVNTAEGDAARVRQQLEATISKEPVFGGLEGAHFVQQASVPILLRLNDSKWQAPVGLQVNSQFGTVVSAVATPEQLDQLENDEGVCGIEASRDAGLHELSTSVPFVRCGVVHRPPLNEKGADAIVGLIDSGIDVLHECFRDVNGESRILAVWNQRDNTGPSPRAVDATFLQQYGTLYTGADIAGFIAAGSVPNTALRDPNMHGTHVASIAAGRAVGSIADGIAPEARLMVVIPSMKTEPGNPPSLGYSNSHVDALHFLKIAAAGGNAIIAEARPIAVNVSLGMNAGAHDGSSTLEAAFDSSSGGGRDPGFVIIKSAGNERGHGGHARLRVVLGGAIDVAWDSSSTHRRFQDYLEAWYSSLDDLRFELVDPAGNRSEIVSKNAPAFDDYLGINRCIVTLTDLHPDNGDSCLKITILSDPTGEIQSGTWMLQVEGISIASPEGLIDVWLERDDTRPTHFLNEEEKYTLSIPGTARYVITVSACEAVTPMRLVTSSSMGRTRDNRPKPDLCAPGKDVSAAWANQTNRRAQVAMTGTSMAAPHVTGAVALAMSRRYGVRQQQPNLTQFNARQIQAALVRSTRNFNSVHNEGSGFGVLDIERFLSTL
jgi:subtilisin family serine protease/pimeloyl-ACP methyl ester carboxylesterase